MGEEAICSNPLGTENLNRLLFKYAVPSVISLLINSLYNIVDQIFIGNGIGYLGNGATNIISPVMIVSVAISCLLGDGLAAAYSLSLGHGEKKKAAIFVGNVVSAAAIIGIIFGMICFLSAQRICRIFGATENIMPYALRYGRIIFIGFPFVILGTTINTVARADGSPRYAMASMIIGAVINMMLDPLFIFVFHWSIEGAAFATVLSQFVSMSINVLYMFHFKQIKLTKNSFVPRPKEFLQVLGLGVASFFNNLASVLVAVVSNNLLGKYGARSVYGADIPITVFGLCMKTASIVFAVTIGIASSSQPIIGYNYGAGKYRRVKDVYILICKYTTITNLAATFIFQCFPLYLLRIFGTGSPLYEEFGVKSFRIYLMLTLINGIQVCAGVLFQAIGKTAKAVLVSLSKQVIIILPATVILSHVMGIDGVLWAKPVTDAAAFLLAVFLSIKEIKRMKN